MKLKNNWKAILFLISLPFFNHLYADKYSIKCEKKNIPSLAKGIYTVKDDGQLIYTSPNNDEINVFSLFTISTDKQGVHLQANYVDTYMKDVFDNNFYAFDEKGNFYFLSSVYYSLKQISDDSYNYLNRDNVVFINKFNPITLEFSYMEIAAFANAHSMSISCDGKWIFVDLIENVNYYFHSGIPVVYAVNGDFKTEPVVVYKSAKEEKINERSIVNLCFDDNTQSLFFSVKGIVDNKKVIGMGGLFQLKPNRNGLYLEENMIQNSAFEDTPFRLFATENGLWGITGDSSLYSKLVHIKDSFGEVISVQNEDINKIAISGCYLYKTDFLVRDNLFFYLDKEKSNIYCYDNDKIRKVTKYAKKK